jgi:hypothetical protein
MKDMTIFAWDEPLGPEKQFLGLFARSPAAFVDSHNIVPFTDDFLELSMTNRGLLMGGDHRVSVVSTGSSGHKILRYFIMLGRRPLRTYDVGGIYLRKFGPRLFYRDGTFPLAGFGISEVHQKQSMDVTNYYILIDPSPPSQFCVPSTERLHSTSPSVIYFI